MFARVKEMPTSAVLSHVTRAKLEFLVISQDNSVFKTVATAIRQVNGRLNCAPSTRTARVAGDFAFADVMASVSAPRLCSLRASVLRSRKVRPGGMNRSTGKLRSTIAIGPCRKSAEEKRSAIT